LGTDPNDELVVTVDRGSCMGAGECVFQAPHTFEIGDDGKSTVVCVDGDPEDRIVMAAQCCPNFAISVVRGETRLV
jgi:ferredoxin